MKYTQQKEARLSVEQMSQAVKVRCRDTHRLLARANEEGIELFCRIHNTSHTLTWGQCEKLRAQIAEHEAGQTFWVDA
jgi:hypothetical protein